MQNRSNKVTHDVVYWVLAIIATTLSFFRQSIINVYYECWTFLHLYSSFDRTCVPIYTKILMSYSAKLYFLAWTSVCFWASSCDTDHNIPAAHAAPSNEHVTAGTSTVLIVGVCANRWSLHATERCACLHGSGDAFKDDVVFQLTSPTNPTQVDHTGCFGCFFVFHPPQRQQVQIWSLSRFAPFSIIPPNFPRGGKETSSPRLGILREVPLVSSLQTNGKMFTQVLSLVWMFAVSICFFLFLFTV